MKLCLSIEWEREMKLIKNIASVLIPSTLITIAILLVYGRQAASAGEQHIRSSIQISEQPARVAEDATSNVIQHEAIPLLQPVQLSVASSLSEIMDAMETAHLRYDTLHVVVVLDDASNSGVEEVWLTQSLGRFRDVRTLPKDQEGPEQLITVSDGEFRSLYFGEVNGYLVLPAHQVSDYPQPAANERQPNVEYANWIEAELPHIGLLLAPKEFVNIDMKNQQSVVTILGEEKLLGRNTIKISAMAPTGGRNIWVDAATGIILKSERLASDEIVAYTIQLHSFSSTFRCQLALLR